jgi:hypothetical protein
MSIFQEEISSLAEWQPPLPSFKVPKDKLRALSQVMQLNATAMMQLSRSLDKGDIQSARLKLRRIYQRMDGALRQMDSLARAAK